jgi:hypothetical protein
MAHERHEEEIARLAAENGDYATRPQQIWADVRRREVLKALVHKKNVTRVLELALHLCLIGAVWNVQPIWLGGLIYVVATAWSVCGVLGRKYEDRIAFMNSSRRR